MKQLFIEKKGTNSLILFFAGWGMDEHPFIALHPQRDLYLCYDYTQLEALDVDALKDYQEIMVYGWSLGVWAAGQLLLPDITPRVNELPIRSTCAIAGTPFPIHEHYGIAPTIYEGTLNGLTERTLDKFNLRMCGHAEAFKEFKTKAPQRSIESLKNELASIRDSFISNPNNPFEWDMAMITEKDRIFTVENQQNAWQLLQVETRSYPYPHFSDELFSYLLNN